MTLKDDRDSSRVDRDPDGASLTGADSPQFLRKRAETLATERDSEAPENLDAMSPENARRVLHELRVHQIELEMQNEELRRSHEELEVSRARYFDLYDLAPVGYFTLSRQGVILEANLTAATMLNVPRGALVKQPLSRFVLREDQDVFYLYRKALMETGVSQAWELRMLRKDAAPFWVRVVATVANDADGVLVCRAIVSDVSESKRAADERAKLEVQNRQLQKAEGLGRMAGAIAHHFNNHLSAVMGSLELAISELPPGLAAEQVSDALLSTCEAAEVSKLLLTYLGQSKVRHEAMDLSAVCRRSLPMLRATMSKGMTLVTNFPTIGPAISGDVNQIQQALINLVTNAYDAGGGDAGGAIHVAVKTVRPADISAAHRFPIDWSPQNVGYACLEVVDPGSGIPEQDIESLFDPFFSSRFPSRGLGLPVVLGIAREHKGVVTVETGPNSGSAFRLFLPVSGQKVLRQPDEATQSAEIVDSCTVLLVEDEPILRKIGTAVLSQLGIQVLQAKDGVEAVEIFRQHAGDIRCVVCDLTMPRMDGWETLAALRKLAPSLPVILASGYDAAHAMAGEHAELPQAFLSKPYQLQELRDAIGRALVYGKKMRVR